MKCLPFLRERQAQAAAIFKAAARVNTSAR
jgi:hypothetical protein